MFNWSPCTLRWKPPDFKKDVQEEKPTIEFSLDMFDQVVQKINAEKPGWNI